jgi:hypothetical protein
MRILFSILSFVTMLILGVVGVVLLYLMLRIKSAVVMLLIGKRLVK